MKIGIYSAGEKAKIQDELIDFIAVDKGYEYLLEKNITPILTIGDFDSIKSKKNLPKDTLILPCEKSQTDTAAAIEKAIELGYKEIFLYGVTGNRLDHFIAIMRLLVYYSDKNITIYNDLNKIYILQQGKYKISKEEYKYISFFSITSLYLSIDNVKYPLKDYHLFYNDALCVSNEIIGESCNVKTSDLLYVIQSNDNY